MYYIYVYHYIIISKPDFIGPTVLLKLMKNFNCEAERYRDVYNDYLFLLTLLLNTNPVLASLPI